MAVPSHVSHSSVSMTHASFEQQATERIDLDHEEGGAKISKGNIANGVFYLLGVVVVCVCQFGGGFLPEGKDLSVALSAHATILSASHSSWDNVFLVWITIFAFEAVFVLAQFCGYRDHAVVKKITFWWVLQCALQIAYFVLLILDSLPLAVTAVVLIANFVVIMLIIGIIEGSGKRTFVEYWTLRAPFSMHAGYLLCESIAWLNILLQQSDSNKQGVVIATSWTGITAVITLCSVFAMAVPRPDGLFCAGVSYNYYWVALELLCDGDTETCHIRKNLSTEQVSDATLQAFQYAALSICFTAGCFVLLAWGLRVAACMQRGRVLE